MKNRKITDRMILAILFSIIAISIFVIVNKGPHQSMIMYGETFSLSGREEKYFYKNPKEVLQVYGYDKRGNIVYYEENIDYIINYYEGTIARINGSLIPDYEEHKVIYQDDGNFGVFQKQYILVDTTVVSEKSAKYPYDFLTPFESYLPHTMS